MEGKEYGIKKTPCLGVGILLYVEREGDFFEGRSGLSGPDYVRKQSSNKWDMLDIHSK